MKFFHIPYQYNAADISAACNVKKKQYPKISSQNHLRWRLMLKLSEPLFIVIIRPAAKKIPPTPYK